MKNNLNYMVYFNELQSDTLGVLKDVINSNFKKFELNKFSGYPTKYPNDIMAELLNNHEIMYYEKDGKATPILFDFFRDTASNYGIALVIQNYEQTNEYSNLDENSGYYVITPLMAPKFVATLINKVYKIKRKKKSSHININIKVH